MHIPLWTTNRSAPPDNATPLHARTNSIEICLPSQLQAAVPSCALDCLQVFVANNYHNHNCSVTANLNLLCATTTVSGLTIGEGALQCVISNCPGADLETQSGYLVCEGVPGAQPNMAETITATIEFTTPLSTGSTESSTTSTNSQASPSNTSTSPTTTNPTTSMVVSTPTTVSSVISFSSSTLAPAPTSMSTTLATRSSSASLGSSGSSSFSISTTPNETVSPTLSSSTSHAPESASVEHTSVFPSSTAASAPLTEPPAKKQLSSSAVAGIATICVITVGLLIAYLAYTCYVKRRAKNRRRSHRFSGLFPPIHDDKSEPSDEPSATSNTHIGSLFAPNKRFYSAENDNERPQSFWRRSFHPYPNDIGVAIAASTRVSPERYGPPQSHIRKDMILSPVSPLLQRTHEVYRRVDEDRWSTVSSLNEHTEAHDQDLPVLASPRTRSSSRSFSSAGIEKPPPLKLATKKTTQSTARIPLTPTYDNGNYDPTAPQILQRPVGLPVIVRTSPEQQKMNFSMRQPSLRRKVDNPIRQNPIQQRSSDRDDAFPARPATPVRKESTVTNTTTSVYTEFEEDSTPEEEDDKQLHTTPRPNGTSRPPLRDLQWPQVPRPAATKKQAEKTPSPRGMAIIRPVPPVFDLPSSQSSLRPSDNQSASNDRSFIRFTVSSTETDSTASISAIFPTPPQRNPLRLSSQPWLAQQISDAFTSASKSTTTTTPTRALRPPPTQAVRDRYPVPTRRLRTGRPF